MSRPKKITANRNEKMLIIEWDDEHQSVMPFGLLRAACPCASCRGGHEYMSAEPDEAVFDIVLDPGPHVEIAKIEMVGTYALTIEWGDGHHYGIYNWHYLRALCPCKLCRGSK